MFDLKFFKIVRIATDWAEPPPTVFCDYHQMSSMKSSSPSVMAYKDVLNEPTDMLAAYIGMTYPPYFGFKLRVGCANKFQQGLMFEY